MRTSKPISTISYNTKEHLELVLHGLIERHFISDWTYIRHEAEEDEKKAHYHVYMNPNRLLDTMALRDMFMELDPENPTKPLGVIDFKPCSVDDWFLYCQHFKPYLASKLESRKYSYSKEDFVYFDEYTFEDNYNHAFKGSKWAHSNQILELLNNPSFDGVDLIKSGAVPFSMSCQLRAYQDMNKKTYRNGRSNHEGYFVDNDGVISEVEK